MTDNVAIGPTRPIAPLRPADPRQLGDYRLTGRIGRGGMGTVYLAENAAGDRAAVKVINPELADDESFRQRFRQEVESARRVRRFCTAPVLDARIDGDELFIVTEYVDGLDLGEYVKVHGPMRGSSLEHLAVGVATALTAIHGAGVVHRDLKPANVLLSSVGPRVIDFGIARALDAVGSATRTGHLIGTPTYMAPELFSGEKASPASDVFAWACVVAYAGTGRAPFDADTIPAVLYQITHGEPRLDGLDESMRDLIEAALGKDPARRPSAQGLLDRLTGRPHADSASVAQNVDRTWAAELTLPDAGTTPTATAGPAAPLTGEPGAWTQTYGDPRYTDPANVAQRTQWSPPSGVPQPAGPGPAPGAPGPAGFGIGGPGAGGQGMSAQGMGSHGMGGHGPAAPPRHRAGRPVIYGAAALAVAAVIMTVLVVRVLTRPDGPPESLVPLYSDTYSVSTSGWIGGSYTSGTYGYAGGTYRVDSDDLELYSRPNRPQSPARQLVSVDAKVLRAPSYGQIGLYCRGDLPKKTGYVFLVRTDGLEAVIRKLDDPGGSKDLATTTRSVPGFEKGETNRLQIACEETKEGGKVTGVRLRLWVDGEFVAEATDKSNPLPRFSYGGDGLVAVQPSGSSGGRTSVQFDNFELSQIR